MNENTQTIIGVVTGLVGTGVATTINDVLGVVLTAVNIIYLCFIIGYRIYTKIKKAKEDGVITKEEVEDIVSTTQEGISEIKDKVESEVKKHE